MDQNEYSNDAKETQIDVRDVLNYILGKFWIVLIAIVAVAIGAVAYTSTITPKYESTSTLFVLKVDETTTTQSTTDFGVAKQMALTAPDLFTLDFCNNVADELNSQPSFTNLYGTITGEQIQEYTKAESDKEKCIITFTVLSPNSKLSKDLVNAVTEAFEKNIRDIVRIDSIRTSIAQKGVENPKASNLHMARNAIIGALVGAVLAVAGLFVAFIFDDKIKTPDDINRYLDLNVLGVIPEIDQEG